MAHSIYNDTGGINALSAAVAVANGTHVYALLNQSGSAAYIEIDCDTDCTFDPDYSVGQSGKEQTNQGGQWVVSNESNKLAYRIPGGACALFEITVDTGAGELSLNTSNSKTAHGASAANHERVWLAQF